MENFCIILLIIVLIILVNESDMTREERVFGLELCIANSMGEEKK